MLNYFNKTKGVFRRFERLVKGFSSDETAPPEATEIPCHYKSLYISEHGYIAPCCIYSDRYIGNISDFSDDMLRDFVPPHCHCQGSPLAHIGLTGALSLRAATKEEKPEIGIIHYTPTIFCQASCAHCYQNSRRVGFEDNKDLSRQFLSLVDSAHKTLKKIIINGGEVGIHKETKRVIKEIKRKYPNIIIRILSNGCLDDRELDFFNDFIDEVNFCFYGFSEASLNVISKLDFNKNVNFVTQATGSRTTKVSLKYLINPSNIHETYKFLEWAVKQKPHNIYVGIVTNMDKYITDFNPTSSGESKFEYWNLIIDRSSKAIKKVLKNNLEDKIDFEVDARKILGL